ncbi:related to T-SNARE affecting a late Golgi compartment protein 1 [Saccharomycodes ludwigii]|uniref:t-SNARE affecting a late Golgi compartment protein 1 n=1 Tax=Saccharomycodes ludwigii TaxID=36035 RepID=A0A376B801_9ASCO|nr:hypothetical protein SCDLUD_004907 [Saccharomycodes ludwigii]KAH3899463.1 hypothetical protein SCDLUD_004907 [Saccharomycodes ludwigii]SSD60634.1 related to T-SNARE affecting a late Golgi compartment protein 1 [Saccharomycodes ludwigii]
MSDPYNNALNNEEDPFYQVLKDLQEQLNDIIANRQLLDSESLEDINETIQDLENSVHVLESSGIYSTNTEILKRKNKINDLKNTLQHIQTQTDYTNTAKNTENNYTQDLDNQKQQLFGNSSHSNRIDDNIPEYENNYDATDDKNNSESHFQMMQQEMLKEQDTHLENIHKTMQNLRLQANTMGQELEDQSYLLNDLDQNVDTVMGKLNRGRRQLEWVYEKNKEKYNDICIVLLIVVLIILLIVAFIA